MGATDISFLSELWLRPNEINLLKNITDKAILFRSDIDEKYVKGRPFGGRAWIINNSFKLINSDFLNRHVSYVQLEKNGVSYFIIGVYMPFDNPQKKVDSISMYELSLTLIHTLLEKARLNNFISFIIGDFNADIFRKNRFDKLLTQFIDNNNLTILDCINTQQIDHSLCGNANNESYKSNIDHILIDRFQNSQTLFLDIQCNIQDDLANMSDHKAVILDLIIPIRTTDTYSQMQKPQPYPYLDLENNIIKEYFLKKVEQFLNDLKNKPTSNILDPQTTIDSFYTDITSILINAKNESINFQKILYPQQNNKLSSKNNWFTWELKEIKTHMVAIRRQLNNKHDLVLESQLKFLKKNFRRTQRQNIYIENMKNLHKFEKLAKEKNKNKFWRFINKSKKLRNNDKDVSIPSSKIMDHYKNFFYEKYESLNLDQLKIKEEVDNHVLNYQPPIELPFFKIESLTKILDEIKTSNVQGNDRITYDLIKNARSDNFDLCLLKLFNMIIKTGAIPSKLNHSIIKPILKDQKKSSADTNNIRPLSVSNCFAQIFEKLILYHSPELFKVQKNQFGFRKKTSCNHAIFVLKETVLNYTQKKTSCKIASLDAEKAFDKVWRDGLFYKLKQKMNHTYWLLLKRYYDSSVGVILSSDFSQFGVFPINCGVKQGGVISPFLFNIFIDDLIVMCLNENKGAIFGNLNTSILVYADDILLISPLDCHLQSLLDVCTAYSEKWLIKFNSLKSNIISLGKQLFPQTNFFLNNSPINHSNQIKYLGIDINNDFDFNKTACEKFKKVQKSIFSLSYLGLTPNGVSPFLKSF